MHPALLAIGRAAAVASPWLGGASAALGAFCYLSRQQDAARDRRTFLREVALNPVFTPDQLLFYRRAERPIREALAAIADPQTDNDLRTALRKAVASVL